MSKLFLPAALSAVLVIPVVASCQGKPDQKVAEQAKHMAPVTHRLSDRFSVIDNGDSVTWVVIPANSTIPDTTVFVFKGDSAVALRKGKPVPVSAATVVRIKRMRDQLRHLDEMDKEISKISR
jgi:hypothetical protein